MLRVVVAGLGMALCVPAVAGFSIEGSPSVSSERGQMGRFKPYEQEANASFRGSDADMKPRQARYQDAELLVDLAYKPVTQKGTGFADRVDGFADDVPFETAMSMILPTGWQLYKGKSLASRDVPELVGYIGGRTWPEVLGQIGERYALQFHVDWFDRTVVMEKGRQSAVQKAARIRVIAEPSPVARPVAAPATASASSAGAQAFAAKPAQALQVSAGSTQPAAAAQVTTGKSALPRPVLKDGAKQAITAAATTSPATPTPAATSAAPSVAAAPAKPAPIAKPMEPPKPVIFSMQVRSGTLYDNVIRLSREQGWNPPSWTINGDYRITADYTIQASAFPEAMVKLLMLHPIEADVNTAQRKIYVIKEVR
ncbi:hypothetical protein [Pseudomonas sp.]|uniref:hypothetical protein n=1 Tax=Pseudomonas sp. TaxID=306 RepID=UPI00290F21A6|nr:hypothetical protein [Pseudomonas sp.]MDU4254444.1 hypothetical protein [Pseudomonas sp.]